MTRAVVPLKVSAHWLAVDAFLVREVLGQSAWTRIPSAPAGLPALVPYRGSAVCVWDVGAATGAFAPMAHAHQAQRYVVVSLHDITLAIAAEQVQEVLEVPDAAVREAQASRVRLFSLELSLPDQLLPLLDVPQFIADLQGNVRSEGRAP